MLAVKSSFLLCNLFHAQAFYAFLKNINYFLVPFISVEFLIDKVLDTYYSACCLRTSLFFIRMNLLICFEVYKHITCIQLHSCL